MSQSLPQPGGMTQECALNGTSTYVIPLSAHSWVIPPGWGKLCDMVSLLHR